ncbi:MAG: hypothetical protein OXU38_03295 [Gemmatimonadota bacterium]|nr:hypothetical protein [Gemmatimonadota bacterium]
MEPERADPPLTGERVDGRLGADARFGVRDGVDRVRGGLERVGAALPVVEGRAWRASDPFAVLPRRLPVTGAPVAPEGRVGRALGRLIGLPRVVRSAATGLRPTVGTRPARPELVRPGAMAPDPARRERASGRASRAAGVAVPVRGARRFTDVTPPVLAAAAPRRPAAVVADARGAATAGWPAGRG